MYVVDTDVSVVAISGILYQEQEWNRKTILRPLAYRSKDLRDTEMKYGVSKAEFFCGGYLRGEIQSLTGRRAIQATC